jgi:hypothetical protein
MGFTETISSIVEKVQHEVHGFYFQDERGPGTVLISLFHLVHDHEGADIISIVVLTCQWLLNPDRFL